MSTENSGAFDHLIGCKLSAVTFIWDYYQFIIGIDVLSVYAHPDVILNGKSVNHIDDGYKNALCMPIGHEVSNISDSDENLLVKFKSGIEFLISLKGSDRISGGPESLVLSAPDGISIVVGDIE